MKKLGIKIKRSRVRTPQHNGRVERFHDTFKDILTSILNENENEPIDDAIKQALFIYK